MLRNASIAALALVLAGAAGAQTSKRPGAPIRVLLDDPRPASATAPAAAPTAPSATPKTAPAPAKPTVTASKPAAEPKRSMPTKAVARPSAKAESPKPVAKPKPAPKPRAKPKKLPPFPKMERGKPESYRRAIEAWRDLLEDQRIARGGGRYPSYTQALARYQRGVDRYFLATGRSRDKDEAATEKKAE